MHSSRSFPSPMCRGGWITLAVLLFAGCRLELYANRCPYDFTPRPQDPSQLDDALFRIHAQDGSGEQGTAFLVDLKSGYLLTAGHIVAETPLNGEVLAVHSRGRFKLRLRRREYSTDPSRQVDAALLQFEAPDLRRFIESAGAGARAVDVALDFKVSVPKTMSGFPDQADPVAPLNVNRTPTLLTSAPAERYALSGNAPAQGESGGPLFDENGFAIGIVHGRLDASHGQFTMLADILVLLTPANIPLSQNAVRSLSVLDSAREVGPVVDELKPFRLSNLEMIGVGESISPSRFKPLARMLGCPIDDAFHQRALVPVYDDIAARWPDSNINAVGLLRSGESAMNRGLLETAALKIREARTLASRSSDVELKRWAWLAAAESEVALCGAGHPDCSLKAATDSAQTALSLSGNDKDGAALANLYLGQAYTLADKRDKAMNSFDRAHRYAPNSLRGQIALNPSGWVALAPDAVEDLKPKVYGAPQICKPGTPCA